MGTALLQQTCLTDGQFEAISTLVGRLCGINLHQGKKELVKARLNKRLRQLHLDSFGDYLDLLRNDTSADELVAMLNRPRPSTSNCG